MPTKAMKTIHDLDLSSPEARAKWEQAYAREQVREWMEAFIQSAESSVRSLRTYLERFDESCVDPTQFAKPTEVLSWFVNDVNNMRNQGRLDLAVTYGAQMAVSDAKVG